MLRRTIQTIFLLATIAAIAVPTHAFDIRRCIDDAAEARDAPVHATTAFGTFDDDDGTLQDGASYYYVVDSPLLSVNKNTMDSAVRLGFDDGQPSSADVDTVLSQVVAQPASVPADGVTLITLIVIPRDSYGLPLGAGLDVTVDVDDLQPGYPASAVVDRGNGEYALSVVSSIAGSATAVVTVEGRTLDTTPQLTYQQAPPAALSPEGELELIVEDLEEIIDVDPGGDVADKLEDAVGEIHATLDELSKSDVNLEGAIEKLESAVEAIEEAADEGLDSLVADALMDRIVDVARRLAVRAIDAAIVAGGSQNKIDQALDKLQQGDDKRAQGEYDQAIAKYAGAADKAEDAL